MRSWLSASHAAKQTWSEEQRLLEEAAAENPQPEQELAWKVAAVALKEQPTIVTTVGVATPPPWLQKGTSVVWTCVSVHECGVMCVLTYVMPEAEKVAQLYLPGNIPESWRLLCLILRRTIFQLRQSWAATKPNYTFNRSCCFREL